VNIISPQLYEIIRFVIGTTKALTLIIYAAGKMGNNEDLGQLATWLLSLNSSFVKGQPMLLTKVQLNQLYNYS
jgi:hypothetical protein